MLSELTWFRNLFIVAASEPRKNCGIKRKKSEKDENGDDYDDIAEDAECDVHQVKVEDTVLDDHVESTADTRQSHDI